MFDEVGAVIGTGVCLGAEAETTVGVTDVVGFVFSTFDESQVGR